MSFRFFDPSGKVYERTGSCNRCGRCCGDDIDGWCQYLEGRPPGPTVCLYQGYPRPCGDDGNWPYSPDVQIPEGCTYSWIEE